LDNSSTENTKVLLSGASGMLGKALAKTLKQQGMNLFRLVRGAPDALDQLHWNPVTNELPDSGHLEGLSAAVHLSGANVASRRWSAAYKREMTESRVTTTRVLSQALAKLRNPP
jgi:NAD dependent epimerase/dehydratase family enzyme